jgi:ABC-type lipoprotein release transport system permease subunit
MNLLRLAFINIFRHKRRTFLNTIAIGLNLAVIIFYVCIIRGYLGSIVERIVDFQTGHIQMHHMDYERESDMLSLDYRISGAKTLQVRLSKIPGIKASGRRIEFKGLLSNGLDRIPIMGLAIEPEKETQIGIIHQYIKSGRYLNKNDEGILIGQHLADIFHVKAGEYVNLYARTKDDVHNLVEVKIIGIFEVGFPEMDKYFVVLPLNKANHFLNMENDITEIIVKAHKEASLEAMLIDMSKATEGQPFISHKWTYFAQAFVKDITSGITFMLVLLSILMLLAIFSILNSMSMSFIERTKEIGTMKAIGYSNRDIFKLLFAEVTILGLLGVLLGWAIGFGISFYLVTKGIDYGKEMGELATIPFETTLKGQFGWEEYAATTVIGLLAAWIGGIFPVIRATKQKIIEALRFY